MLVGDYRQHPVIPYPRVEKISLCQRAYFRARTATLRAGSCSLAHSAPVSVAAEIARLDAGATHAALTAAQPLGHVAQCRIGPEGLDQ